MIDEKLCNSCKHRFEPEHQSTCWACHDNELYVSDEQPKIKRRMTNFEKIKAMSVDEMAELIRDFCLNSVCCDDCPIDGICPSVCCEFKHIWKNWLESEVDEDGI